MVDNTNHRHDPLRRDMAHDPNVPPRSYPEDTRRSGMSALLIGGLIAAVVIAILVWMFATPSIDPAAPAIVDTETVTPADATGETAAPVAAE